MEKTYIYALIYEDVVKYIGKANNPVIRRKKHLRECKFKRTKKEKWIFSKLKEKEKIELLILDEVDENNWSFFEQHWISLFKSWGFNLLNGTDGGEGSNGFKGRKHTDETKLKCKIAAQNSLGIIPWNKNKKYKLSKITEKQTGTFWMKKDGIKTRIQPDKFNEFIKNGWVRGR